VTVTRIPVGGEHPYEVVVGTGVLGGMLAGAFLGIFFVPLFFVLIQRLIGGRKQPAQVVDRSSA